MSPHTSTPTHRLGQSLNNGEINSPTSALSESVTKAIRHEVPLRFTGTLNNSRKIRSDASILTCFDPADKELFDLWVPRR